MKWTSVSPCLRDAEHQVRDEQGARGAVQEARLDVAAHVEIESKT